MLRLTLAYKYVAMTLMLAEANFFCTTTGLHQDRPFIEQDLRNGGHVGPYNPRDFGGSLLTDKYLFGFGWGHLATFSKRGFKPLDSDKGVQARNLELAKFSSLIDTNAAHELATNWLTALGIDVPRLATKYRLVLTQWRYYPDGNTEGKAVILPVYDVEWRGHILRSQPGRETTVVRVTIFGATKELVNYLVLDDSLFLRPRIAIKDAEKLLAIPDDEFRRYDSNQRSNLIVQFGANPQSQNPPLPSSK